MERLAAGQAAAIESKVALFLAGSDVSWVLVDGGRVIGVMNPPAVTSAAAAPGHLAV